MVDHDVIISGGGPAGLLLACLLTQAGRDVLVFERAAARDERTRAIGIHPPGLSALGVAGLAETFLEEATVLKGGDVISRGQTLAALDFPPRRPVLTIPQARTDHLLHERLETLRPDAVRADAEVVDAVDVGTSVHVAVETQGRREEHRAQLVVVAEGVRSRLRDRLGFGWRQRPGTAEYSMLDVPGTDPDDRARLYLEPAGLVESFPLPGGGHRWVLREKTRTDRTPESFRSIVAERTGIDVALTDAVPASFRARQHRAKNLVRGRVVLLGDAAHEISPIGGQGMNTAWIAACRLAVALIDRPDQERALAAYERTTLRTASIVQRRALFNMVMGAPIGEAPRAIRDAGLSVLASSPAAGRLLSVMTMGGL